MQNLNCLIIEDEPIATEILEDYIVEVPHLQLRASCTDALFALEILQKEKIDVIFLDLHLPKLKGFEFLKTLSEKPQVIVTTAYHQYAVEGYELEIVDYLLKPIAFSRFLKAVNKLKMPAVKMGKTDRPHHFFNVNKTQIKVYLDEILYIESLKEYVKIHTIDKTLVTKFQIGEIERFLGNPNLLRVHRSYLVAKDKVEAFTAVAVIVNGNKIPIGKRYREVIERF